MPGDSLARSGVAQASHLSRNCISIVKHHEPGRQIHLPFAS